MKSAVLFLVFNRPGPTREVFAAIRAARPPRLYVAADGPRPERAGEREQCAEVRRIVSEVDWPCEVSTLWRDENLGCRRGVSGGIDWFFEREESGIVLEDDCLPAPSFFPYCDELLERYRDDARVWQICGLDRIGSSAEEEREASYRFSRFGPIWGWASWRRAWQHYDSEIKDWPAMSQARTLASAYPCEAEREARLDLGGQLFRGEIDTWDFQWGMAKNFNHALSIVPTVNLIRNIGFGADATHTHGGPEQAPQQLGEMTFPLRPPRYVLPDSQHDRAFLSRFFLSRRRPLTQRVRRALAAWIRGEPDPAG